MRRSAIGIAEHMEDAEEIFLESFEHGSSFDLSLGMAAGYLLGKIGVAVWNGGAVEELRSRVADRRSFADSETIPSNLTPASDR